MPRIFDNIEARTPPGSSGNNRSVGPRRLLRRLLQSARLEDSSTPTSSAGPAAMATAAVCSSACSGCRKRRLTRCSSLIRRAAARSTRQPCCASRRNWPRSFREQLTVGAPTNEDEAGLRRLAAQIKAKKVVVKLFLRHPLHAKLYLLFRPDPINPTVGYLGSSNLTLAGLSKQGELNVDVLDHDACQKLAEWFEDRWNDRWCIDISEELVKIIEESWARRGADPALPHLRQDGLPPLAGGPRGPVRVPHPPRLRQQAVRASRKRRSRSPRTTSTSAAAC